MRAFLLCTLCLSALPFAACESDEQDGDGRIDCFTTPLQCVEVCGSETVKSFCEDECPEGLIDRDTCEAGGGGAAGAGSIGGGPGGGGGMPGSGGAGGG